MRLDARCVFTNSGIYPKILKRVAHLLIVKVFNTGFGADLSAVEPFGTTYMHKPVKPAPVTSR